MIKMKFYEYMVTSSQAASLLGVSDRTARRRLNLLRFSYQKSKNQVITIEEFCDYFDVPYKTAFCLINKVKFTDYDKLVADGLIQAPAPRQYKWAAQ